MSIPDAQKLLHSMNRLRARKNSAPLKIAECDHKLVFSDFVAETCKLSVFIFRALRHLLNIVDRVEIDKLLCAILNGGFHSGTHLCKANLIIDDPISILQAGRRRCLSIFLDRLAWMQIGTKSSSSIDGTWHVSTATSYSSASWIPSSIVNFFSTLAVRDEVEDRKHGPCGSYENR